MNSQPVLIRQTKSIMKGGKVLSVEVLYERPKVEVAVTPPPPIKKPESPPTPTSPTSKQRPEFMEPLSTSPSSDAYRKAFYEEMKKREQEYYEWEAEQPSTYRREIELLERRREKYNKMASWSAKDAAEVDKIDKEIAENQKMIDWLVWQQEEDSYDEDSE
jgi:hypothetical protein